MNTATAESTLTKSQTKEFGWKVYRNGGQTYRIKATVRYDDQCGNGHNSFSITGEIEERRGTRFYESCGGCIHDEIAKHFPELAPFLKWHLMSSDGPMHYIANTVYHAGDRDHNGLLKGEVRQIRNGETQQLCWKLKEVTLPTYIDADEKPTDSQLLEYEPWNTVGTGKERNLKAARDSAIWPEASDEQLCAEPDKLKEMLTERLRALIEDFRKDVESLGFIW